MQFVLHSPSPRLAPFVSKLWFFAGQGLAHARERVMPGTGMQLLINLHEDELRWWDGSSLACGHRTRGAAVGGLYLAPFAIDTLEQQQAVGVVFQPGGAAAILGVPADRLAGTHTELDAIWPGEGARLRERVAEAGTPAQTLALLDAILVERLGRTLDPVVSYARTALERGARVATVAGDIGLGTKRLRARFSAAVGVTPKAYARLARLQRVLRAAAAPGRTDWAQLAQGCGYYDQAHLIQEFRSLTGLTPMAYRPRSEADHNHVVIPA